ncbi:hypothetical protein [Halomicrobium zhouii]|uniref:hypothetical protein n=1 Tax=Halomicrobium zhouii TaxID=767519 RepID=UPI0015A513D8|nr:hypothetical protein [Halomicrobium zhouii]
MMYAVGMLAYVHLALPTNPPADSIGMTVLVLGGQAAGMILLSGGPIYLLLRLRLVSPVVFAGLCTALSITDLFDGGEFTVLYVGWWFFFVAPLAFFAVVESVLRAWFEFFSLEPLV